MVDRILNHLCDYALNRSYRDLPEEVIRQAKHIVLDTVGCALGGAESPPAKIARAAAAEITSAVPSTVLIGGQKTSPDLAAFANGVMIRYLAPTPVHLPVTQAISLLRCWRSWTQDTATAKT
jgi:2-methylcitrate dehydratase